MVLQTIKGFWILKPCSAGQLHTIMVTVAIATGLTSYIPMMYADNIEQGLQVCKLLKEIEPKEVYTVVSSADLSLNLEHVKDYSWKEELV